MTLGVKKIDMNPPSLRIVNSKSKVDCEPSCFTLNQYSPFERKYLSNWRWSCVGHWWIKVEWHFFSSITVIQWVRVLMHCKQKLLKANSAINGANTDFTTGSLSQLLSFLVSHFHKKSNFTLSWSKKNRQD